MQPGDTITITVGRQTAGEQPAVNRSASDFVVSCNGELLTLSDFTEIGTPSGSLWCDYSFEVTDPGTAGRRSFRIEPAINSYSTDVISLDRLSGEVESYDMDALAGAILTSQGTPGILSQADSALGDVVEGDAWQSGTLTIPLGKVSPFGYSDLTGMTISAAFKSQPSDSPVTCTAEFVSAAGLTVKAYFDTFPVGMNLGATEQTKTWYLDIQCKHTVSGRIITVYRGSLNVVWERNEAT
jgi:hypothetical protein